jgi:bifunctional DNA primase/polymerase-like protein
MLGDTVAAGSPRDGRHLYFAYDARVTTSKANALGPGIDVKTDGGYIVAPPSFWHGNGLTNSAWTSSGGWPGAAVSLAG